MPVGIATAIAEAVLFGLHAAHEARDEDGTPLGIVHRDVSPQNVLVGADGVPRLIDFGIAKAATRIQVTDPGTLKGKAGYMAPEQLLHEPCRRATRTSSLGVGRPVGRCSRTERSSRSTCARARAPRRGAPGPAPCRDRAGIDAALDEIVLRGLSRDPARRFPTAEAMAIELRHDRKVATAVDVAKWMARTSRGTTSSCRRSAYALFEQTQPALRSPEASTGSPLVTSVPTPSARAPVRARLAAAGTRVARGDRRFDRDRRIAPRVHQAGLRGSRRRRPARPPSVESVTLATPPAQPLPSSAPPVSPPLPSGSANGGPAATSSVASAAPSKPATGHAPGREPSPNQGSPRRAAKPKCDPPYTLDADGFKHYDPRCF